MRAWWQAPGLSCSWSSSSCPDVLLMLFLTLTWWRRRWVTSVTSKVSVGILVRSTLAGSTLLVLCVHQARPGHGKLYSSSSLACVCVLTGNLVSAKINRTYLISSVQQGWNWTISVLIRKRTPEVFKTHPTFVPSVILGKVMASQTCFGDSCEEFSQDWNELS